MNRVPSYRVGRYRSRWNQRAMLRSRWTNGVRHCRRCPAGNTRHWRRGLTSFKGSLSLGKFALLADYSVGVARLRRRVAKNSAISPMSRLRSGKLETMRVSDV